MKILFVAMTESIHTASWIKQIADQGWEIHLFSVFDNVLPHPEIKNTTIHQTHFPRKGRNNHKNKTVSVNIFSLFSFILNSFLAYSLPSVYQKLIDKKIIRTPEDLRLKRLCSLIKKLRPDIIHTMEFQAAGCLILKAKKRLGPNFPFPKWIATIWGSDIYWFGRFKEHRGKIKEILKECDYYSCECQRDVYLAQKYGLKGQILSVGPVTAGFDLKKIAHWRREPPSKRKLILLKGRQGIFGRALVGLQALKKCAHLLEGYKIKIYYAGEDIITAGYLFEQVTGIPVSFIPLHSPHDKILKLQGQARLSISLSISDGICVSFLESLAMGSLPIQSTTSCSNEWAKHNQGALFVPPDDSDMVAKAIHKALTDDKFVDEAAKENWATAKEKLGYDKLKQKAVDFYKTVQEGPGKS